MATSAAREDLSEGATGGGAKVVLGDRYRIHVSTPLPALSTSVADAYLADDATEPGIELFAMVGDPDRPTRHKETGSLLNFGHPHLMRLVAAGRLPIDGSRAQQPVYVFERPQGGALMLDGQLQAVRENDITRLVIEPIGSALKSLYGRGVHHRAIHPENLFFADRPGGRLVLGECLSSLPGQCQPLVFEPLETATAPVLGRGAGGDKADCYALGVTVLALLTGAIPGAGRDDDELLHARIEQGSRAVLTSGQRFGPRMETLLSGLLEDQVSERWGLVELGTWLSGRHVQHSAEAVPEKASKSFAFGGHEYTTPRALADAFNRDWDEAAPAIRSEWLEKWLATSANAPGLAHSVEARREEASGLHTGRRLGTDDMVARVCISLDLDGPIRYRGVTVTCDGIGSLLAGAYIENRDEVIKTVGMIIASGLPAAWVESSAQRRKELNATGARFIRLKQYMNNLTPGFGIERCLYELNPGLRCLSTMVNPANSHDPTLVLAALGESGGDIVDAHITGYLAAVLYPSFDARLSGTTIPHGAGSEQQGTTLVLLAMAQRDLKAGPLPKLAQALRAPLDKIVDGFFSRGLRKRMAAKLDELVVFGDLTAMEELLGSRGVWEEDKQGFKSAVKRYAKAEAEIDRLHHDTAGRKRRALKLGHRYAAKVALAFLGLTTIMVLSGYVP